MKYLWRRDWYPGTEVVDADGVEIVGCVEAHLPIGRVMRPKGGQPPFEPHNGRGITGVLHWESPYEQGWCKPPLSVVPKPEGPTA